MRYVYGAASPRPEHVAVLEEQLRLAHAYRNKLVEIERERRRRVRELLDQYQDPGLAAQAEALAQRLEALRSQIRTARQASRSRAAAGVADLQAEARAVRKELAEVRKQLREERRRIANDPVIKTALHAIDRSSREALKEARADFSRRGLYWPTYGLVEQAAERMRRSKADPRFRAFTGEGTIAVHLQGGLPWKELFSGRDTRIQIDPVPPEAWRERGRRRRAKLCKTVARIRIGSNPDRSPRWIEVPVWVHRPMPEGARIKAAYLQRRRQGLRWIYALHFAVELPSARILDPAPALACGIDLGWRKVQDGLRVAYLVGEDGYEEEVVLPGSWLQAMEKVWQLQSIADLHFGAMRDRLVAWLDGREVPDWLHAATAGLSQWRSAGRLRQLAEVWAERRFHGDEAIFEQLWAWRQQDRHLYTWASDLRAKLIGHRRDIYRVFAARVAARYRYVCVEAMDLRKMAELGEAEAKDSAPAPTRTLRHMAALSVLRQCLSSALRKRGGELVAVDPKDTTRTCHVCGRINRFVAGSMVLHRCEHCQTLWDQDRNAAINLLRRGTGRARSAS
ncbi:zinc ribbon domain-containing protein [Thermaerobacter litoralis]